MNNIYIYISYYNSFVFFIVKLYVGRKLHQTIIRFKKIFKLKISYYDILI